MNTRVKICGVKREVDLEAALDAGADAIGLNFVASSPRYLEDIGLAEKLMRRLEKANVLGVGVFAKVSLEDVVRITSEVGLTAIQLHGEEPIAWVETLRGRLDVQLWKAFRVAGIEDLDIVHAQAGGLDAVVLDSRVPGALGGTGQAFDWSILKSFERTRPLVLAGGLKPDNVRDAVRQVRPDWVDAASGVESEPGIKNAAKITSFIQEVRGMGV